MVRGTIVRSAKTGRLYVAYKPEGSRMQGFVIVKPYGRLGDGRLVLREFGAYGRTLSADAVELVSEAVLEAGTRNWIEERRTHERHGL